MRGLLGHYDHIVPVWAIYSNHDLRDPAIYEDDYIVHASNYGEDGNDNFGYVRPLNKMVDTLGMTGNCKHAQKDVEKSEAFPCFDQTKDYGVAVKGLRDPNGVLMKTNIVSPVLAEPNIRTGATAVPMEFLITARGLTIGNKYELKKFEYNEWPHDGDFAHVATKAEYTVTFVASLPERNFYENIMGNGPSMSDGTAYFAVWEIPLHDPRPTIDEE